VKINFENNLRILKKLRKLVIADIKNYTQLEGFEDTVCEFEEWLNEIEGNIVRLKKKTNLNQ